MSERAAFIRAICDAPNDDAPRLILADWLDDHDEGARAEFIRVTIRLARHPIEACDSIYPGCEVSGDQVVRHDHKCEMYPFANRCRELLEIHKFDWLGDDLKEATVFGGATPEQVANGLRWSRGFVEAFSCTADDAIKHLDAIREHNPIRKVELTTWPHLQFRTPTNIPSRELQVSLNGRKNYTTVKTLDMSGSTWRERRPEIVRNLFETEWPGIEFNIPPNNQQDPFQRSSYMPHTRI